MIKDMVKSSVVALAVLAICGNVYAEDNTENTEAQSGHRADWPSQEKFPWRNNNEGNELLLKGFPFLVCDGR